MTETVLSNALVVTRDDAFEGTVVVRDGVIVDVARGSSLAVTDDLGGDYLLPGLVELHTDNLERHFAPRPGVLWPTIPAMIAHDAQIAAAGITTVLDAIAIGDVRQDSHRLAFLASLAEAVEMTESQRLLRAHHMLHLRCEVSFPELMETFTRFEQIGNLRLVSVMDHTPGQRQFLSVEKYRSYYQNKYGFSSAQMDEFMTRQMANRDRWSDPNRAAIVARCRDAGIPLASHDDATNEHVDEAVADGMVLAEFPTTFEAAKRSRDGGMKVLMGGPNLVRGGSHSGNVSARDLAEQGLLDVISSDYVPFSLLHAAFILAETMADRIDLPGAVAMASHAPARAIGLDDRGDIAIGQRADLIRVQKAGSVPIVRTVWVEGSRVV